jgi:hypothetical protein
VDFLWRIRANRGITPAELWIFCEPLKNLEIAGRNPLWRPARRA